MLRGGVFFFYFAPLNSNPGSATACSMWGGREKMRELRGKESVGHEKWEKKGRTTYILWFSEERQKYHSILSECKSRVGYNGNLCLGQTTLLFSFRLPFISYTSS
jgi:hypothetical protein